MNNKSKGEKLFIIAALFAICFAILCFTGCSGSCMGCTIGCENSEGGCASGIGCGSDGCLSSDSCMATLNCVDFQEPYDDDSGDVLLISCATQESGCGGEDGCYNGLYLGSCSSCGTFGMFCGSEEDYNLEEFNIGCIDGCFACGDTEGIWGYLLENLYYVLGLK